MIEKYLTFCKNHYLDTMMEWRLKYMNLKLTRKENWVLQMRLDTIKFMQKEAVNFESEWHGVKDFSKMGQKIENIFPLLDPDLNLDDAKVLHMKATSEKHQAFMTEEVTEKSVVELRKDRRETMEWLCSNYSSVMPFIPEAPVLSKLVLKATQLQTEWCVLNKINPKELRRKHNELDLTEELYEPYCEIRVRPLQIKYPNMQNGDLFYHDTGLMHLRTCFTQGKEEVCETTETEEQDDM